jgi:hypothetical protein
MRTDGQRDMTELTVAFRNFATAPKKGHADRQRAWRFREGNLFLKKAKWLKNVIRMDL